MTQRKKATSMLNDFYIGEPVAWDVYPLTVIERNCFKFGDRFTYKQMWYLVNKGKGIFRLIYFANLFRGYFYLSSIKTKSPRIYSLAIDPSHQGMGMGGYALNWIERLCRDLGATSVRLEVRIANKKAIKFYQKHGFKKYDRKTAYYTDGSDAILMKKDLQCQTMDS